MTSVHDVMLYEYVLLNQRRQECTLQSTSQYCSIMLDIALLQARADVSPGHALAVQAQTCGGTQQCAYKSSAMILV
eukprot:4960-Heterococcus_DN1.PRE.2